MPFCRPCLTTGNLAFRGREFPRPSAAGRLQQAAAQAGKRPTFPRAVQDRTFISVRVLELTHSPLES